jgi:cytochrome bd-type quinol oxidase subunit 2
VKERLRAPAAAAAALLIGGDLAAFGPAALLDVWRFLFPYLWLFLAYETARRRRRMLDDEAFLFGAAVGLVHGGLLTKTLQNGVSFLGVDWLNAAIAAFDWGLVTVAALHAVDAWAPRPEAGTEPEPASGAAELAALVFLPAAAVVGYLLDALDGRARVERMLGPAWLLADALLAAAAGLLARRAFARSESMDAPPRDRGLWALAALAGWLPGAQLAARLGGEWPSPMALALLAAWTAGYAVWFADLWRARGRFDAEPRRRAAPLLAAAAWRLAAAALLCAAFGPTVLDPRSAAAFTFLVDLPVRLVFISAFFRSRLNV